MPESIAMDAPRRPGQDPFAVVAVFAIAGIAAACSRSGNEDARRIALLPRIANANSTIVRSAAFLDDRAGLARDGVYLVGAERFEGGVAAEACTYAEQDVARLLAMAGGPSGATEAAPRASSGAGSRVEAGQALVRAFPVEGAATYEICVDARERAPGASPQFTVLELGDVPDAERIRDPDWIRTAVIAAGGRHVSLVADGRRVEIATGERTLGLLVVARALGEPIETKRIELFERSPFVAGLLATPIDLRRLHIAHLPSPPPVPFRSVEVQFDHREALVFAAPGGVEFEIDAGDGHRAIEFAIAGLEEARTPALAVTFEAGSIRRSFELAAPDAQRWTAQRIELEGLQGRERVAIAVKPLGPTTAVGCGVALASLELVKIDATRGDPASRPPDVVLISIDTVRADMLPCYGGAESTAPFLAEFARDAMVFDNCVAPGTYTLPSHVSLFTGQFVDRHGVLGSGKKIREECAGTTLLAERFRAAGYRTLAFTGGGYVDPSFGFARGFDRYVTLDPARTGEGWREPASVLYRRKMAHVGREDVAREALLDELATPSDTPRFLFVHTYGAHNYSAPERDLRAVGLDPAAVAPYVAGTQLPEFTARASTLGSDADAQAEVRALYRASIRMVDGFLRDVLAATRAAPGGREAIVVIVSDHGEEIFEHGGFGHGHSVYEEQTRVPFLLRGPGIAPGRTAEVVSLVDVAPTLLQLAAIGYRPDSMDGVGLLPLLRGETHRGSPPIATALDPKGMAIRALRGPEWKWIGREDGSGELFRVPPGMIETVDLAATEPARAERMASGLAVRVKALAASSLGSAGHEMSEDLRRALKELGYLDD
jgi:arylsulfatase A-like enzyme